MKILIGNGISLNILRHNELDESDTMSRIYAPCLWSNARDRSRLNAGDSQYFQQVTSEPFDRWCEQCFKMVA